MTAEVQTYADSSVAAALQRHADPLAHTSYLTSVDVLQGVDLPTRAYPPAHVEYLEGAKSLAEEGSLAGVGFLRGVAHNRAKYIAVPDLQIGPPAAYWAAVLVLAVACLVPPLLVMVPSGGIVQYHIS